MYSCKMQCKIKWVGWQWGVAYYNGARPHFLTIEISAECSKPNITKLHFLLFNHICIAYSLPINSINLYNDTWWVTFTFSLWFFVMV